MKIYTIIFLLLCSTLLAQTGNRMEFKVVTQGSGEPLVGATIIVVDSIGSITNVEGVATFTNIPDGTYSVKITYVGFRALEIDLTFPTNREFILAEMEYGEELEEVTVMATRSSRTIEDIPTRIELISSEELNEKSAMRSSNIAMLLRESTGILMQQTSASSANQSIRIQGLDGRYTQILKDGFPLYGGFSGGLSIMQIPPLDLRQVEVIKGSNSTLYGGGAIAGLVNLVTYQPQKEQNLKLMLDQNQVGGTTFNSFYARQFGKVGVSFFTSANRQNPYDPNEDSFSDIPRIRSLTINPSLFYDFNKSSQLRLTLNSTFENRFGGDMGVVQGESPVIYGFTEENESKRLSYQLTFISRLNSNQSLSVKNTLSFFDRSITEPGYVFQGKQIAGFTEVSYRVESDKIDWVAGINLYTDDFNEEPFDSLDRSYNSTTFGGFIQNNLYISRIFSLETGLRGDYDRDYGFFALPRFSLLSRLNRSWSIRIGGGMGYKLPTIFSEEAENLTYEGILPLDQASMKAERSAGGNLDINFRTFFGDDWTFSVNQLFFYTRLNDPLIFRPDGPGQYVNENANGPVNSKGLETNIKLTYKNLKLFANYALIDTRLRYDELNEQKPLTPRHNAGLVLMYEEEEKWRVGYEAYYTGRQFRNNGTQTRDFWIMGIMAMRQLGKVSLYLNFENFIDTRQHKLESFDITRHFKPLLPDFWAPTEGSIINGGVILDL